MLFHNKRHPKEMTELGVEAFLAISEQFMSQPKIEPSVP
ncbi:hypothetical protein [Acaryochloris sp. CCMEE 5410]